MILDTLTTLSEDQDLSQVAGAYYSDIWDSQVDGGYTTSTDAPSGVNPSVGKGTPLSLLCMITETFTSGGAATLAVSLQTSVDEAFSVPITIINSPTYALADLVVGKHLLPEYFPFDGERFFRIKYTIGTATTTAGTVEASIGVGIQSNR